VKRYWEIIADNLSKAGWSLGWVTAVDSEGRTQREHQKSRTLLIAGSLRYVRFCLGNHRRARNKCDPQEFRFHDLTFPTIQASTKLKSILIRMATRIIRSI
jgi:hypothetical protein